MLTPSSTSNPDSGAHAPPPAKRRRIGYACDPCRAKKNRCDGERPTCGPCKERNHECVYSPQRARISVTQEYVDSLKARNEFLEQQLAWQENGGSRSVPARDNPSKEGTFAVSNGDTHPHEGVQLPLSSQSEQHIDSQSVQGGSHQGSTIHPPRNDGSPGEYFGESSAFDFIAKVSSPTTAPAQATRTSAKRGPGILASTFHAESLAASSPSTVVFEELLAGGVGSDAFELPQRSLADKLVDSYFKYRHPLNPFLHEGSFRTRYHRLWLSKELGGEEATQENLAWLGLVNLVFAFGTEHVNVQASTSRALLHPDRSRFFKKAKTLVFSGVLQMCMIELVQAFLLMSHYLHASLELNNCWTVVGIAIRTAQQLGLYLDPADFTSDVIEQEIRKRVWWGCFVIDQILCLKVGRPPTIRDTPAIRVGLPLPVDDEYLNEQSSYSQPVHIPSKLEFFNQIVEHCRLIGKVFDTLYTGRPLKGESKLQFKGALPELLALSIKLDGELVAWQDGLPAHLRPGSGGLEWHFERQKNMLLMRFLNTQLLVHRRMLLFYITSRISDPFQLDLIRPCIKRCVMAACELVTQMRLLRQQNLLSSFWHNSHYVFAALGVLLVYRKIDSNSRAEIGIPSSLQIDDIISQGLENLQQVGGAMHPLASRYVQSFKQLQSRLRVIPDLCVNSETQVRRVGTRPASTVGWRPTQASRTDGQDPVENDNGNTATPDEPRDNGNPESIIPGDVLSYEYNDNASLMAGFNDDFAFLQSVLLDTGEWTQFFNECEQS